MYQTVRIDCHSFLQVVHISVRCSKFILWEKPQKWAQKPSVQLIARSRLMTTGVAIVVYIQCIYTEDDKQNGDTSKHWVSSTGSTASQSTFHGDDHHWADIYEEEIVQLYWRFSPHDDFPLHVSTLITSILLAEHIIPSRTCVNVQL